MLGVFNRSTEWEGVGLFLKLESIDNFSVVVLDFKLGNPLDFASSFVTNVDYWVRFRAFYRKLFVDVAFVAFAVQQPVGDWNKTPAAFGTFLTLNDFLLIAQNCKSFFSSLFEVLVFVCGLGSVVICGGADATLHAFEAKFDRAFFDTKVSDERSQLELGVAQQVGAAEVNSFQGLAADVTRSSSRVFVLLDVVAFFEVEVYKVALFKVLALALRPFLALFVVGYRNADTGLFLFAVGVTRQDVDVDGDDVVNAEAC